MIDKTKITVQAFDDRAQDYQDKYMDIGLYEDTLDRFCEVLKKEAATILELACGPGNITQYLLKKRSDFQILGTDLSPKMLQLAQANNPLAHFHLMDCRAIQNIRQMYDAVVCGFGLPYLSKEEALALIADAARIIVPDGLLYLSTMEDDYSKSGLTKSSSGKETVYMYYHQADYLVPYLQNHQFEIVDLQRKEHPQQVGTTTRDLIIIARKLKHHEQG